MAIIKHRVQPKRVYRKSVRQDIIEKCLMLKKGKQTTAPVKKEKEVIKPDVELKVVKPVEPTMETIEETQDVVTVDETVTEEPKKPAKKASRKKKGSETEENIENNE